MQKKKFSALFVAPQCHKFCPIMKKWITGTAYSLLHSLFSSEIGNFAPAFACIFSASEVRNSLFSWFLPLISFNLNCRKSLCVSYSHFFSLSAKMPILAPKVLFSCFICSKSSKNTSLLPLLVYKNRAAKAQNHSFTSIFLTKNRYISLIYFSVNFLNITNSVL